MNFDEVSVQIPIDFTGTGFHSRCFPVAQSLVCGMGTGGHIRSSIVLLLRKQLMDWVPTSLPSTEAVFGRRNPCCALIVGLGPYYYFHRTKETLPCCAGVSTRASRE